MKVKNKKLVTRNYWWLRVIKNIKIYIEEYDIY